jgi:hypothetical protein
MATLKIIGMSLDELSVEVAAFWRLPQKISKSMTSPRVSDEGSTPGSPKWLKTLACFASDAVSISSKEGSLSESFTELVTHYSDALLMPADQIMHSFQAATNTVKESCKSNPVKADHGKPIDSGKRLSAGVSEAISALTDGITFSKALNLVLETMFGSMRFNRVIGFLHDGSSFCARAGFGAMMPKILNNLEFSNIYSPNVFHLALTNNADIFIEKVASMKPETCMPIGFNKVLHDVRAFILLPLSLNGKPVGLLYADWAIGTTGIVEKSELQLLSSLRNHMITVLAERDNISKFSQRV